MDIEFNEGAKLEAHSDSVYLSLTPFWYKFLKLFPFRDPILTRFKSKTVYEDFVLECWSDRNVNLIFESFVDDSRQVKFRHSFQLKEGWNSFTQKAKSDGTHIYVYPEHPVRIIFKQLNFVKYKLPQPAEKVKCVAWDLDNTLWDGILAEGDVIIKGEIVFDIEELDKRGIIQTIVSKNDHNTAWKILENARLDKYFVYPAINWGQKSENLKKIAEKLNINLDTFALIDDSKFEREEVKQALPQVRVYSNQHYLFSEPEFDVPITETSAKRRESYQAEVKREEVKATYSGDYEDFLRSLNMELEIFTPTTEKEIARCHELIQRSNQLHLNGNKYTRDEFERKLKVYRCYGLRCKDDVGNYGIIGFCCLKYKTIVDFVMSCRIAQRKVEQTFFKWLGIYNFNYVETERNGIMKEVLFNLETDFKPIMKVYEK